MQRVLAVLGAVVMVVAALAVRNAVDGDGGGVPSGDRPVVMCAADLVEACRALGDSVVLRSEPAAATAAALADGSIADDVDAWVTTSAWVEVLTSRAPTALDGAQALASTATVMATAPGRYEAVNDLCGAAAAWRCLGDAAGQPWGDLGDGTHAEWRALKVGVADPDSAVGLSVLASAAAGYVGTPDFATNDQRFGDFEGWLANLAGPSAASEDDPALALVTRPGAYSAAGTTAATADRLGDRGVQSLALEPSVAATVVITTRSGHRPIGDASRVAVSLVSSGWAPASGTPAPTLKPGVMAALHSLWGKVTR